MLQYLCATATQGSADAYAETAVSTGLSNVVKTAMRIRSIEWFLPALPSADSDISVALKRKTGSSVAFSNVAVIAGLSKKVELTTSGSPVYEQFPNVQYYERDMDLLIVEETLYFQIDSTTTSAANVAYLRIGFEYRTVTENERLQILAATATAA